MATYAVIAMNDIERRNILQIILDCSSLNKAAHPLMWSTHRSAGICNDTSARQEVKREKTPPSALFGLDDVPVRFHHLCLEHLPYLVARVGIFHRRDHRLFIAITFLSFCGKS
jgi:hypothetical protein